MNKWLEVLVLFFASMMFGGAIVFGFYLLTELIRSQ